MHKDPFEGRELQFPVHCHFRIIAEKKEGMKFVIETVLMELGVTSPLQTENESQAGRFQSFSVDIRIESQEEMKRVDAELRAIAGVRMVL